MSKIHVIVTTHTTRHLRRTLMGVASQWRKADSVTVTIDGDGAEILELVRACAEEFAMPIRVVSRVHQGVCRSAQVRNNGARAAIAAAMPDDMLVFYDGDCCPAPEALERYERLFERASWGFGTMGGTASVDDDRRKVVLVIGHWITLTPEQTEQFDERALRMGKWPAKPDEEEIAKLPRRRKRYMRQLLMRKLKLAKGHKPKLASGNFGIRVSEYVAVNGFDELYEGYGQEDDDLGRRVYKHGGRVAIGVDQCLVFHQWHPTRQPGAWETAPGVARFKKPYGVEAERGLKNPVSQPDPVVEDVVSREVRVAQ
ncbi:MAG: glycosyltransferase [Phycisphaerales bacterium]|nr:glycosyltransferase [Phycisphaerales bacterium]